MSTMSRTRLRLLQSKLSPGTDPERDAAAPLTRRELLLELSCPPGFRKPPITKLPNSLIQQFVKWSR
jgi:hypothetical protein